MLESSGGQLFYGNAQWWLSAIRIKIEGISMREIARKFLSKTVFPVLARSRNLDPTVDSTRRYKYLMNSFAARILASVVSLSVNIVSIPITIKYLEAELFGVWVIITTFLTWVAVSDMGLNNGLTNKMAEAFSKKDNDLGRIYVSTTIFLLTVISGIVGLSFLLVLPHIPWTKILGPEFGSDDVVLGCSVAILLFIFGLPLSTTSRILSAYQEPISANVWLMLKSIVGFVGLIAGIELDVGFSALVICFFGVQQAISLLANIWLFAHHMPGISPRLSAIDLSSLKATMGTSGLFLLIQLSSLAIFQTDSIVISWNLGPASIAPYSVALRLFSYATMLQTILLIPLWSAYAEALEKNDQGWIRATFLRNIKYSVAFTLFISTALILFGEKIIHVWTDGLVATDRYLLVLLGIQSVINATMICAHGLLNSYNKLLIQAITGLLAGAANIVLSIYLVGKYGVAGVVVSTITVYLVFIVIPVSFQTSAVLKKI